MRIMLFLIAGSCILLIGCAVQSASFFSPFNGSVPAYRPMIVKQDSLSSALHLNAVIYTGTANESGHANSALSFNTGVSKSHSIGKIGFRYGLNAGLGSFHIEQMQIGNVEPNVDPNYINAHKGPYFFGSYGTDGGFHYIRNSEKTEWRVLGIEWSVNREFGKYLALRKQMPSTVAPYIDRHAWFGNAGIYTEIVDVYKNGKRNSLKIGYGQAIPERTYSGNTFRFEYFTMAYAFTRKNRTVFTQFIAAEKAGGILIGLSYRFSSPR
jgi:hypothetical protein